MYTKHKHRVIIAQLIVSELAFRNLRWHVTNCWCIFITNATRVQIIWEKVICPRSGINKLVLSETVADSGCRIPHVSFGYLLFNPVRLHVMLYVDGLVIVSRLFFWAVEEFRLTSKHHMVKILLFHYLKHCMLLLGWKSLIGDLGVLQ